MKNTKENNNEGEIEDSGDGAYSNYYLIKKVINVGNDCIVWFEQSLQGRWVEYVRLVILLLLLCACNK